MTTSSRSGVRTSVRSATNPCASPTRSVSARRRWNTFVGDGAASGDEAGTYRFHVDFAGGAIEKLRPRAAVTANVSAGENGQVLEHFVEYNEAIKGWRLSILARPGSGQPLTLRAFLREGDNTVSETWSYVLPARNDIQRTPR
jgi:periplasmic glucans biosynthesis protein